MEKVVDISTLHLYKEAVKRLDENNIDFDRTKLLNDPELCEEVIRIIEYYSEKD